MRTVPSPSQRTTLKRRPERGAYDTASARAVFDAALNCHVAFVAAEGHPVVLPTIHGRIDDRLYIHGSVASRLVRTLATNIECCVSATIVDGLVYARSAFHMSMNYRSVVAFGRATLVQADHEKVAAMRAITERLMPGRWADVRPPARSELAQMAVVSVPLEEASVKIRSGPPVDEAQDYERDVWAGVVPLRMVPGPPAPDPLLPRGQALPPYLYPGVGQNSGTSWAS